jgi:hypothetical protein
VPQWRSARAPAVEAEFRDGDAVLPAPDRVKRYKFAPDPQPDSGFGFRQLRSLLRDPPAEYVTIKAFTGVVPGAKSLWAPDAYSVRFYPEGDATADHFASQQLSAHSVRQDSGLGLFRRVGEGQGAVGGAAQGAAVGGGRRQQALPALADLDEDMVVFLEAYTSVHAKIRAQMPGLSGKASPGGSLLYRCQRGFGGLADQIKGMVGALLLAMVGSMPRALFIDCDYNVPLRTVWTPRADGIDWTWKREWRADAHRTPLFPQSAPDELYAYYTAGTGPSAMFSVRDHYERATFANMEVLMSPRRHVCMTSNNVALVQPLHRNWYTAQTGRPLPRMLRQALRHDTLSAHVQDYNGVYRLLDFLFAPSAGVVREVLTAAVAAGADGAAKKAALAALGTAPLGPQTDLAALGATLPLALQPGRQWVVGLHLRGGGTASNKFADPKRMDLAAAVPAAAACARLALEGLVREHGARPGLSWIISCDDKPACLRLKKLGETVHNATVVYLEPSRIVHTDRMELGGKTVKENTPVMETYAEHFLLSATHAIVRGKTGFSSSAAFWGHVPLQFVLDDANKCSQFAWTFGW